MVKEHFERLGVSSALTKSVTFIKRLKYIFMSNITKVGPSLVLWLYLFKKFILT